MNKRLVTTADIERYRALADPDREDSIFLPQLDGYAAQLAANELIRNWESSYSNVRHVSDFSTIDVDADLNRLINALVDFRIALQDEAVLPSRRCEHVGCENRIRTDDPEIVYCGRRNCAITRQVAVTT